MSESRQILTPGDSAPPVVETPAPRGKPGPKPKAKAAAAPPADDLDEFEDEALPPASPVAFSPEQMAEIQKMIGAAVQASKASQDPQTAAKLAAAKLDSTKLPTVEAAKAMAEASVAQGIRPRAVLTGEGWYVHPDMTRTAASVGLTGVLGTEG